MLKYRNLKLFALFVFVAVVVLIINKSLPLYAVLIVFGLWILTVLIGSLNIRSNFFFHSLCKNRNIEKKAIALTFDDGPSENTLKVLEVLKRKNVKASFFCIGHKIDEHPEIFKQIIKDGHSVGNHSYSHEIPSGFFGAKKWEAEIRKCDQSVLYHSGLKMNLFRPPFGVTTPKLKKALKNTGHVSIGWSKRPYDTVIANENLLFRKLVRGLKKGDVVLLHDTMPHSVKLLERLLLFLREHDFETITLESLFKIDAYR